MAKHIVIVGCSAEGAAFCYQTICREGAILMGPHTHPEVSMHTHPLREYMEYIYRDETFRRTASNTLVCKTFVKPAGSRLIPSPILLVWVEHFF